MSEAAEFWNPRLAPGVSGRAAYAEVERAVRALFTNPKYATLELHTAEVVEALYPEREALGEAGREVRQRIFRGLAELAKRSLADCCYKGPPKMSRRLGQVRPWMWHAPRRPLCPHCGGELAA